MTRRGVAAMGGCWLTLVCEAVAVTSEGRTCLGLFCELWEAGPGSEDGWVWDSIPLLSKVLFGGNA